MQNLLRVDIATFENKTLAQLATYTPQIVRSYLLFILNDF